MVRKIARLQILLVVSLCLSILGCPGVPLLSITPLAINFGSSDEIESFTISNPGGGTITWTIAVEFFTFAGDGSEVPDAGATWLNVSPLTGTTTSEIDRVVLTADRTGLTTGTLNARITITTTDGQTEEVLVAISTPGDPLLTVNPGTININCPTPSGQFFISNTGEGALSWTITVQDPDNPILTIALPDFMTVSPTASATLAGTATPVTITIDCAAVPTGVQSVTLVVNTSVGTSQVLVAIGGEGIGPSIGVDPSVLDFGQDLNTLTFDVFNTGETGSILDFAITTNRPDLIFINPTSGTSLGVITDVSDDITVITEFDRQAISVTIDRSAIMGTSDGGTITITADGLDPVTVAVLVERAPLTIEGAANRARPPSLQRFVFLLRDSLGQAIQTSDPAVRQRLSFTVEENGELLDLDETNFFISGPENLKVNLVLMLDFTGSMFDAGLGNGTAIEESKLAAKEFIDDLPASWRVAVMEYHDRQQSSFLIHTFDTDKASLKQSIDDFSLAREEHGASAIFDALGVASLALVEEDNGLLELDDADVRAVVFVSDGRDTSSTVAVDELISFAEDQTVRVRFYPIGFGENINNAPLVSLAIETGGHPYSAVDTTELATLLGTPTEESLIANELRNQVVLTYVSLVGMDATYLITASFEVDVNEFIEGSFQRDGLIFLGDVRAGQISATTTGISSGTAEVFLRADYVPRNVNLVRFRIFVDPNDVLSEAALDALTNTAPVIELAPEGILIDPLRPERTWRLVLEPDATLVGIRSNFVWTVLTEETNPLPFGSFGNMVRVTFPDLDDFVAVMQAMGDTPVFELGIRVDNRVYFDPPTPIFWEYPGGRLNPTEVLRIGSQSDTASPALTLSDLQDISFDPDAPDAFNQDASEDEGGIDDFDDRFPNNDNLR